MYRVVVKVEGEGAAHEVDLLEAGQLTRALEYMYALVTVAGVETWYGNPQVTALRAAMGEATSQRNDVEMQVNAMMENGL